jgi:hypothetical protein
MLLLTTNTKYIYFQINQHTVSVDPIVRQPLVAGLICKRLRITFIASFALIEKKDMFLKLIFEIQKKIPLFM